MNSIAKTIVVGIAGGSGSGKTTLSEMIRRKLGVEHSTLIPHDCYYKNMNHLSPEERSKLNFDHPNLLETSLLIEHIRKLKDGVTVEIPRYDFKTHSRMQETSTVTPKTIVIVEGILLLNDAELRSLLDIKIFIDTESDIRFIRRLKRDMKERGRDVEDITQQYLSTVRPMHIQFVEPSKKFADIIIPEGGYDSHVAIEIITSRLENFVAKAENTLNGPRN